MNFLRQGFRNLSSDRETDRQTDTTEIIFFTGGQNFVVPWKLRPYAAA